MITLRLQCGIDLKKHVLFLVYIKKKIDLVLYESFLFSQSKAEPT
jgi:hypothetical protein